MNTLNLTYSEAAGWVLDVPHALPDFALRAAAQWALRINTERFRAMPHGDRKDRALRSLKALEAGQITQRITARPNQEVTLFRAERGTGKIISQPGI